MPPPLAATHTALLLMSFATLLLTPTVRGQVEVQFQIKNPPSPNSTSSTTIDSDKLAEEIQQQGVAVPIKGISQTVDIFLKAQECPKGTYSENAPDGSQICQKCPAGTASPSEGASSISACVPCSAGSFSLEQASQCTDCAANTFSFTQEAPAPSYCLRCPQNTTSPVHSGTVEMCICDPGFFLSDNLMHTYPYDTAPIALSLAGATSINTPHVSCLKAE